MGEIVKKILEKCKLKIEKPRTWNNNKLQRPFF